MLAGVISLLTSYGNLDLIIKYQIKSLVGMSGMVYWLKINKINKMSFISVYFFSICIFLLAKLHLLSPQMHE